MHRVNRWLRRIPRRLGFEIQPWPSDRHIMLEYPVRPRARDGARDALLAVIDARRETYRALAAEMACVDEAMRAISIGPVADEPGRPFWRNDYLPPQDARALAFFLHRHRPVRYVEVGAGMSTRFARFAIDSFALDTRITSIDPTPRLAVSGIADEVIAAPLGEIDPRVFSDLVAGDILFFDGSHYTFPGSDVTVFFLEILPKLKPGVVVQVHDIFLPDDYPQYLADRFYSEQYMLATLLMFAGERVSLLYPARHVATDPDLRRGLPTLPYAGIDGASFWFEMR